MGTVTVVHPGLWGWFVDNGPGVSSVVAIVTGLIAIITLVRASRDSRAKSRPVVVAELRVQPHADTALGLVVRNAGSVVARDIAVTFDPPLDVAQSREPKMMERLQGRFAHPIGYLAPGQELETLYAHYVAWQGESRLVDKIGVPYEVTAHVRYRGSSKKHFDEYYPLSLNSLHYNTYVTSSTSIKGSIHQIALETKKGRELLDQKLFDG